MAKMKKNAAAVALGWLGEVIVRVAAGYGPQAELEARGALDCRLAPAPGQAEASHSRAWSMAGRSK